MSIFTRCCGSYSGTFAARKLQKSNAFGLKNTGFTRTRRPATGKLCSRTAARMPNIFRPWGYQPGHLTEWAKVLIILERHKSHLEGDTGWMAVRAGDPLRRRRRGIMNTEASTTGSLLTAASATATSIFWVQAESLAAAALLAVCTKETTYWDWYERVWTYSWEHFVDHRYGATFPPGIVTSSDYGSRSIRGC